METPVGTLLLTAAESGALTSVSWRAPGDGVRAPAAFAAAVEQLEAYFAGALTAFDLPLAARGTAFQQRVWAALDEIPYGATTTYGELARDLGVARDRIRAVGAAVGANPLLIVRPCHRVIGADGSLTGYAGGVERKHRLLTLEGALQPVLFA